MLTDGAEFDRVEVPFTWGFNKTDSCRFYMNNLNCLTKIIFSLLHIGRTDQI